MLPRERRRSSPSHWSSLLSHARFYVGTGGAIVPPNLSLAPPKSLVTATVCNSKTSKPNSYTGGVWGGGWSG